MIHILGIGSPFGDDRLGWELASVLQNGYSLRWAQLPQLNISLHDRPGLQLLEAMQGASQVFLLDAVSSGASPGTLHFLDSDTIQAMPAHLSSHGMGIAESIALGNALGVLPESIQLYGIEMDSAWMDSTCLSPAVRQAIPVLINTIMDELFKLSITTPLF